MVTSGDGGSNHQLLEFGNSKMPTVMSILNEVNFIIPYKHRNKELFDKDIMMHWVLVVF